MQVVLLCVFYLLSGFITVQAQMLDLPPCPEFDEWLAQSGAQPPDYDSLPSVPFLQNPLETSFTVTLENWPTRRAEISDLVEDYLLGHAPPAPGNVQGIIVSTSEVNGQEVWNVRLEFGPDHSAKLNCTLYVPRLPGKHPIFLCNGTRYLDWLTDAMENHGFGCCVYNATDRDDESEAYADLFGDYDWAAFRRRGWSASRAIDWLETLPFVDTSTIIIGGHSRSGKQAMAGAAFDKRIAGIIASSPGSGAGSMPYRYADQYYYGESIELITRTFPKWVIQRARFYAGRENKFPADSHFLYALFAPRPLLMSTALHDFVENTWAIEQVYLEIQPVYELLGKPENIGLRYRDGKHSADEATKLDFNDFMLTIAGISTGTAAGMFPFNPVHPWNYDTWASSYAPTIDVNSMPGRSISDPTYDSYGSSLTLTEWMDKRQDILTQLDWLLGSGVSYQEVTAQFGVGESEADSQMFGRDTPSQPQRTKVTFGNNIYGQIYYPSASTPGSGKKYPGAIWLGPFYNACGYNGYYRDITTGYWDDETVVFKRLMQNDIIALAYDHIGTAGRQYERREFYKNYPDWSLMGKMVLDARYAIDAMMQCPEVDNNNIYLYGYGMGGMIALFTAAIDDRVKGVVCVAGFTPFLTDTDSSGTGGVRRYSHLYGWIPRLGLFVGNESKIPVDFHEIISCMAPKKTLIMAPVYDWHATYTDVENAVHVATSAFALMGNPEGLTLYTTNYWNRLSDPMVYDSIAWMRQNLPPAIWVNVNSLDFGNLDQGKSASLPFNISNIGRGTLSGTISSDERWIELTPTSFILEAGSNAVVNVTVNNSVLNKKEGKHTGTIHILSNGGNQDVTVALTATCVLPKPNPYNPEKGPLTFFGDGIVLGKTEIKIYTLSGELITELKSTPDNPEITWDGKTRNGSPVVAGIYIYTYESPKEKGVGKFTIIRK